MTENLKFDERGLIPAVVQDAATGEVLTLAYMNAESLAKTLATRETWFWSRSRRELWRKGATSGHTQRVVALRADCDGDALLVLVEPRGPACHTGAVACFAQTVLEGERQTSGAVLEELQATLQQRQAARPEGSYSAYLFEKGLDKILKKVGEEAAETIIAAKNEDAMALVSELADLCFHVLALMVERGVPVSAVRDELRRRQVVNNERERIS
jgi:phosphoribosyl-ATP pyrophosphohydrolase/phosphoribosyl-AMP cyclohydrolase